VTSSLADVVPEALAELSLPTLAVRINEANRDAQVSAFAALEKGKLAGDGLWAAKALCPHGTWMHWVRENMDFSQQTALNYMRLSKGWAEIQANSQRVVNLSLRQALELLSDKPEEPEPTAPEPDDAPTTDDAPRAELFGVPVWFGAEPSVRQQPVPVREEAVAEQPQVERMGVHYSSASDQWNTPAHVVEKVSEMLGGIDLDPCSNEGAPNVPAESHFTVADNGLSKTWSGKVYMNPPYGDAIPQWTLKLHQEYAAGNVTEAIALLPARTDTAWFYILRGYPRCFIRGRLKFGESDTGAPFPSVAVYLGNNLLGFAETFKALGDVYVLFDA
jgi:hypothetical protein